MRLNKIAGAVLVLVGAASQARASITFVADWSGVPFGNPATAQGFVTIDQTTFPNPVSYSGSLPPWLLALSITVSGAGAGNGTFTAADFSDMVWNTGGVTLNLNQQLVGQGGWGPPGNSGSDFNFFPPGPGLAPSGVEPFILASDGGAAFPMELTSLVPTPEPATLSLFFLGAAAFAVVRKCARKPN